MLDLGIFGLEFENDFVMLKIMFVMFLTHTANFGIGSTFSEGAGTIYLKIRVRVRVRVRFIKYVLGNMGNLENSIKLRIPEAGAG